MGYAFYIVLGLGMVLMGAVSSAIYVCYYGVTHMGKIRSSVWISTVVSSSLGPFLMWITYNRFNTNNPVLVLFLNLIALMVVAPMFSSPPKHKSETAICPEKRKHYERI